MLSTWTVIGIWIGALALVGLAMGTAMAIEGVRCARSVVRKGKRADRRILAPLWGVFATARKVGGGHVLRARDWRSVRAIFVSFGGAVALVALGAAPLVMLLPLWYAGTVAYHAGAQIRRIWVRSLRSDRRALVGLALGTLAILLIAGALGAGSGAMLASAPLLALPYRRPLALERHHVVAAVKRTDTPRYGRTVDGYSVRAGAPTSYMVRLSGSRERWRRVMVWQSSNAGTAFVRINGEPWCLPYDTLEFNVGERLHRPERYA